MTELPVTTLTLAQVRALASPVRQRILEVLIRDGVRSVGDLCDDLGTPRSTLYHHVRLLHEVGLIVDRGSRATRTRPERIYGALGGRMRLESSGDPAYRSAVLRLYDTHFSTLASRLEASLERDPSGAEHRLLRYRASFDDDGFQEFMGLLNRLDELVRRRASAEGGRVHWITVVQVPEGDGLEAPPGTGAPQTS